MKKLVWIAILTLIFGCGKITSKKFSVPKEPVKNEGQQTTKTRYFIFLVHGIGGSEATFPNMPAALENHLNRLDPSRIYHAEALHYDTGNDSKTTLDFAKDISKQIKTYMNTNGGLQDTDKISFVVHSQGGLVVSQLLFLTLAKNKNFFEIKPDQFDAFVTLGTPFWGSKSASWGGNIRRFGKGLTRAAGITPFGDIPAFIGYKIDGALDGFGNTELADMKFYSNKVNDFFNGAVMMNEQLNDPIAVNLKKIRVLNIAGYVPESEYRNGALKKPAHALSIGLDNIETDNSVIVPAARSDFLYLRRYGNYSAATELYAFQFKETHMANFVVVPALHVNPSFPKPWTVAGVKLFRSIKGIAQIDKECIKNIDCDHPTFKSIVDHILGQKVEASPTHMANMSAFMISFNIALPKGYNLPTNDLKFEWQTLDRDVRINNTWELGARGASTVQEQQRSALIYANTQLPEASQYRRYYFTGGVRGSFNPNDSKKFKRKSIFVRIHAMGLKDRKIEIPIRASYSTMIDINMDADGTPTREKLMTEALQSLQTMPY